MGQGAGHSLMSLLLGSDLPSVHVLAGAAVPSETQMGKDPLPSFLRWVAVGRIHLLALVGLRSVFAGCQLKTTQLLAAVRSCLTPGPHTTWQILQSQLGSLAPVC